MDPAWYHDKLYPLQDAVLAVAAEADTEFHLKGGTALGRVDLHHRFSDDLDFFVNDDDRFAVWADRLLASWAADSRWTLAVERRDTRFVRVLLTAEDVPLKLEFVNDRWIEAPPVDGFLADLRTLGEELLLVR